MMGPVNKSIPGMYLLAGRDIYTLLADPIYDGFTIEISFYEIYCGKLFDLLNGRNMVTARVDAKE
jgi:kinesin family protein 2/24